MKTTACLATLLLLTPWSAFAEEGRKGPPRIDPEEIKGAIAERDRDGDGRLNADEFGAGARLFRIFDRNQDGFLTAEDLAPPRRDAMPPAGDEARMKDRAGMVREAASRMMTHGDKDGDGKISREEYPAEARIKFEDADANKDGFLDLFELTAGIEKQMGRGDQEGRGEEGERLKRMFKEMDPDGDGRVTREEWKGPEAFFDRLDADKDGVITKDEVRAAGERMGKEGGRMGQALFKRADMDGDGRISRTEWTLRPELFDRLDANGDGFIDPQEITAQGPRREGRDGKDGGPPAGGFFAELDKNRDGKVTREEFPNDLRFREMDGNGDGILTPEEVEGAMGRRRREEAYGFLEKYDVNGDGKVTREEFTGPAAAFEAADRNHDGVVDGADRPEPK